MAHSRMVGCRYTERRKNDPRQGGGGRLPETGDSPTSCSERFLSGWSKTQACRVGRKGTCEALGVLLFLHLGRVSFKVFIWRTVRGNMQNRL